MVKHAGIFIESETMVMTEQARLQRMLGFMEADPGNELLRTDVFELALAQGAFDVAQQCVAAGLAAQPGAHGWQHRSAILLIAQHRYAEAALQIESLLAQGATDPVLRYNLAYLAYREGRYDAASTQLTAMLDVPGVPPQALPLLLRCLHQLGALEQGVQLFQAHATEGQVDAAAFGVASLMAVDLGRVADARAWVEQALRADPDQQEALVAGGSVALAQQDAEAALPLLQHALARHGQDGRTWSALGIAFLLRRDMAAAQRHFEQAARLLPEHIGTWHGLAWSQLLSRELAGAQTSFQQALELDRNFGESHGGLAVVLALQGQGAAAQEAIERALRLDPRNVSARYAEAILNGDAKDMVRFRQLAERVLGGQQAAGGASLADIVLRRRR